MKYPTPINVPITGGANAAKASTDTTLWAEEYIVQASAFNTQPVVIGLLDSNSAVPAGPWDDTNALTMYTLPPGASVPLRPSLRGRLNGEAVKISDLWVFCSANARLIFNPQKKV